MTMKRNLVVCFVLLAGLFTGGAHAQDVAAPSGQQSLAATVGVYVFPAQGQSPAQQNREEAECYSWAVNNTRTDPFEATDRAYYAEQSGEAQKAAAKEQGKGAGAKGAVRGAAAGALIGEIADNDAGTGAAYGAAVGAIAARRKRKKSQKQATQEIDQQVAYTQQVTAEQIDAFKKAFSVCLEAKAYMVKF